jgi:hypothetical protein
VYVSQWLVPSLGIAAPMGSSERGVRVSWYQVVSLPRVIVSRAIMTDVADGSAIPNTLSSPSVISVVIQTLSLFVSFCCFEFLESVYVTLVGDAPTASCGQDSTVQARLRESHLSFPAQPVPLNWIGGGS